MTRAFRVRDTTAKSDIGMAEPDIELPKPNIKRRKSLRQKPKQDAGTAKIRFIRSIRVQKKMNRLAKFSVSTLHTVMLYYGRRLGN